MADGPKYEGLPSSTSAWDTELVKFAKDQIQKRFGSPKQPEALPEQAPPPPPDGETLWETITESGGNSTGMSEATHPGIVVPPRQGKAPGEIVDQYDYLNAGRTNEEGQRNYDESTSNQGIANAYMQHAEADAKQSDAEANTLKEFNESQAQQLAQDRAAHASRDYEAQKKIQQLEQVADRRVDEGRFFRKPGSVFAAIGAALMPLAGGNPMNGVNMIDKAIQRDIDMQQFEMRNQLEGRSGALRDFMALSRDSEEAAREYRLAAQKVAIGKLDEIARSFKGEKTIAQAMAVKAELEKSQARDRIAGYQLLRVPLNVYPTPIAKALKGHSGAVPMQTRGEVEGDPYQALTPEQQKKVNAELAVANVSGKLPRDPKQFEQFRGELAKKYAPVPVPAARPASPVASALTSSVAGKGKQSDGLSVQDVARRALGITSNPVGAAMDTAAKVASAPPAKSPEMTPEYVLSPEFDANETPKNINFAKVKLRLSDRTAQKLGELMTSEAKASIREAIDTSKALAIADPTARAVAINAASRKQVADEREAVSKISTQLAPMTTKAVNYSILRNSAARLHAAFKGDEAKINRAIITMADVPFGKSGAQWISQFKAKITEDVGKLSSDQDKMITGFLEDVARAQASTKKENAGQNVTDSELLDAQKYLGAHKSYSSIMRDVNASETATGEHIANAALNNPAGTRAGLLFLSAHARNMTKNNFPKGRQ